MAGQSVEGPSGLSLAYVAGMILAPFALLFALASVNETGPQQCRTRDDVSFNGKRLLIEHCTGRLGLSTNEPRIVRRLD